jgi:hypothetical protein
VFSGSFAATPGIVALVAEAPAEATASFFHLPLAIELARFERSSEVPDELRDAYFSAIAQLAELAAGQARDPSAQVDRSILLACVALAGGDYALANVLVELDNSNMSGVLKLLRNGEVNV